MSALNKRLIIEPSGTSLSKSEAQIFKSIDPAGIMLRARNFSAQASYKTWTNDLRNLLRQIQDCLGHQNFIVSIDHEGGRVVRPPPPITRFPYQYYWGDHLAQVTQAVADELKSIAVNVLFGPVCDIHSNEKNPVIAQRAFGTTADQVISAAKVFVKIIGDNGIIPCVKHFPGHGDTEIDSHLGLPIIKHSAELLGSRELLPFGELIKEGVPMVMSAHLLLEAYSKELPATFSKEISYELLRNELGFNGVLVSDALGMRAICNLLENPAILKSGLEAELDLFLVAGDNLDLQAALNLKRNLESAAIDTDESHLENSSKRIEHLLGKLKTFEVTMLSAEILEKHAQLADILKGTSQARLAAKFAGFE